VTVVLTLDTADAREPAIAGEKAAALARMKQAGLPVPPGFVVTTAVFDDAFASITPRIDSLLAGTADNGTALAAASRESQSLVAALPLAETLRQALRTAYAELAGTAANEPAVAVRSSGTAEDLAGASFAGQYDSYLNIAGSEAILDRMRAVWASGYSAHAIAYRNQRGIPHTAARMAVLVQQQVAPDASGVLFTRNPITGAADRILINATYGLGEGVVAGEAAADTFALDSASFEVVERTVIPKPFMVGFAPSGGIKQQPVAEDRRDLPALSDQQLAALGRLAQAVQRIEGDDRDIEFAVTGSDLHLLQARPVTGLEEPIQGGDFPLEWETPDDEQHLWTLSAGFGAPAPLPRFAQEVQRANNDHRRRVFEETGSPQARAHFTRFLNGYQYVRGPEVDEAEVARRVEAQEALADAHARNGRDYYVEEIEPPVRESLAALGSFKRPAGELLADRFRHLRHALESAAYVMGDLHWRMAGAGNARASITWPATFAELTGEPPVEATTLLQSIDHKTTRLVRRLRAMARIVQGDQELRTLFAARNFDQLAETDIRSRPAARQLRARLRSLLRDYGRRSGGSFGSSTSFASPTWNLNPQAPLALVASYAEQDLDELDILEASSRRERLRTTRRIRRALASDPERLARFNLALLRVHDHVRAMENHNFYIEQGVVGVLREAIWWTGQALVRDGRLDDPDQALHLSLDELQGTVDEETRDIRALAARHIEEFERQSRLQPPQHVGNGDPATAIVPPGGGGPPSDALGLHGRQLKGQPASRGRHTGRARVFRPGGAMPTVVRGDILVARNAGQDWTPILPLLGGIVLDEGAIFQHAALVAREYRIPCIIQTGEATTAIIDGQSIAIDGEAGIVELDPVL
jgi:pyruvate,water dikinase